MPGWRKGRRGGLKIREWRYGRNHLGRMERHCIARFTSFPISCSTMQRWISLAGMAKEWQIRPRNQAHTSSHISSLFPVVVPGPRVGITDPTTVAIPQGGVIQDPFGSSQEDPR